MVDLTVTSLGTRTWRLMPNSMELYVVPRNCAFGTLVVSGFPVLLEGFRVHADARVLKRMSMPCFDDLPGKQFGAISWDRS